jgi:hypothetical protein
MIQESNMTVPGVEKQFPGSLFPSDTVSNKDRKWHLQAAKAIWSEYSGSPFSTYVTVEMPRLRAYGKGQQDEGQYKKRLNSNNNKSYRNLDWENVKIAPKYIDVAMGMMGRIKHKVSARSIDPLGLKARDQYKHYLNAMDIIRNLSKSNIVQKMAGKVPVGEEQIELHMSLDYKQAIEIAMEDGLELVFQRNNYKDLVAEGVRRDLFEVGIAGTKTFVDSSGMIRIRRVEPEQLVVPPTKNPDFSDARYIGEVVYYTIGELREMDVNRDITEEQWAEIIRYHQAKKRGWGNGYNHIGSPGVGTISHFDSYKIQVLDFEYMSYDKLVKEKKENRFGGYGVNRRDPDYEPPKKSKYKREIIQNTVKNYRRGKWIVGTDYILDWGLCDRMVRGNKYEGKLADAKPSYSLWCVGLRQGDVIPNSHLSRMIPHIDELQLARLQLQNLIAKARPKGVKFDIDMVAASAATLGMGQNDVRELIRWFDAEGHIPYSSRAMAEQFEATGHYSQNTPVEEMENGISRDAAFFLETMWHYIRMIQEVTGLTGGVDASSVDPNAPVATTQMAAAASSNALIGLVKAEKNILLNTSFNITKKLQQVVKEGKQISGYIEAMGENKIKTIQLSEQISQAEFGIYLEDLPTDEEVQRLEMMILKSLDSRMSHGRGGVTLDVALRALRLAKINIKEAERFLAVQHEKQREIDQQQSMQEMQMNAQVQQQSAAQAHQARMMEMDTEHQHKLEQLNLTNEAALERAMLTSEMKGRNDLDNAVVSQAGKERLEAMRLAAQAKNSGD